MAAAWWTVDIIRPGDPARVALGITDDKGYSSKPVEVEVPLCVLEQGSAQVARYFIRQRRQRYALRHALNLPALITFSE